MSLEADWKSRWGDPPLLPVRPLSARAVWAFFISFAVPSFVILRALVGPSPFVLIEPLRLLAAYPWQLAAFCAVIVCIPVALVLAYCSLAECSVNGKYTGRPLAWCALAVSLLSLIYLLSIIAPSSWLVQCVLYGAIAAAFVHIPVFAAESRFAKYLVVTGCIGITMGSLLSCGILRSRETARRLQCTMKLIQMGSEMSEAANLRSKSPPTFTFSSPTMQSNSDASTADLLSRDDAKTPADRTKKWLPKD